MVVVVVVVVAATATAAAVTATKLVRGFDFVEAIVLFLVHAAQMNLVNHFDAKVALDKMLVGIFAYLFDTLTQRRKKKKKMKTKHLNLR